MLSHPLHASRCLNSLLRYELAAVRCYQFAEQAVGDDVDRAALAAIRRDHAYAVGRLGELVAASGQTPSADPGMWGVIVNMVETSAAVFGRKSMFTVLLWVEQHAVETYEASPQLPGLDTPGDVQAARDFLSAIHGHAATLEALVAASQNKSAGPCAEVISEGESALACK